MLDIWYGRVGRAKPFLRWAGGKQYFLFKFADRLPHFEGTYFEPFLGSGAVYFHLKRRDTRPRPARLGDRNRELIRTFLAVRDEPETVHSELAELQNRYEFAPDRAALYYELRDHFNSKAAHRTAALFIFLNRTCWNGLYRTNRDGAFNVPYGAPKTLLVIPTLEELLNASAALVQAEIRATGWQYTVGQAQPGDFVFFDPPYYSDVVREDSKYGRRQFGLREHERLAQTLQTLSRRGIAFILTNSAEPEMVELYGDYGLHVEVVAVQRSINSKTDQRVPAPEIIVGPGKEAGAIGSPLNDDALSSAPLELQEEPG
jgi:DNA adenine methylase